MECVRNRVPYASWRLAVFRQLFVPSIPSAPSVTANLVFHRELSSSNGQNESRLPPDSLQHGSDPKNEKNEKKTLGSKNKGSPSLSQGTFRPSQLLPQSPLLTRPRPGVDKKRKRRPAQEDLNRLRLNPWAMALASPPRMCTVTGARVPWEFLTEWGLIQRRDDEGLWLMPIELLRDELSPAKEKGKVPNNETEQTPQPKKSLRYLSLRIIDRLPLLKDLTMPFSRHNGGRRSPTMRLIPFRWKHPLGPLTAREEKKLIWREDMPEFVLEQMRKHVLKQLREFCDAQKRSKSPHESLSALNIEGHSQDAVLKGLEGLQKLERMECGAVLIMGLGKTGAHDRSDAESGPSGQLSSQSALPEFVIPPQLNTKVPVLDLSELFSEHDLAELRSYDARFENSALFLKPDDAAGVQALLALWKLQALLRPNKYDMP